MTPQEFVAKWERSTLTERSACQQHFLDLCRMLGQPTPAEIDPDGDTYTFEKGLTKAGGGQGFADVWLKGRFGWEYKKRRADLAAAYKQLVLYAADLENPPLLVVCDMDRFEVHTNFTGKPREVHAFALANLAEPGNLDVLRAVFTDPGRLEPGVTSEVITERAAKAFGQLADGLRARDVPAEEAAHFLMKLMFCMFADDIGLLRNKVFTKVLESAKADPPRLAKYLRELFGEMSQGGDFWGEAVLHFNGGLFADADVIELTNPEIGTLRKVNDLDWSAVEPSIFGTLFERMLDPDKRSQIGAHYTSREDIETLLEPVMMTPLRREWDDVRAKCEDLTERAAKARTDATKRKHRQARERALIDFVERLSHVSVLDPACGSGNFLYVALHLLLDLEKEVIAYAARNDLGIVPHVNPTQLAGIEINPYAQQLAQVVIWIGYLQWMRDNGFRAPDDPVLNPMQSIECRDAILDLSNPEAPLEPEWPKADFIVGNPPFLGGNKIRSELGDDYVESLFALYDQRVPAFADLCCYWFEKGRDQIRKGRLGRAGLLATQGIRGGANRVVLDRIKDSGAIFFAVSDSDWVLDGATVHVSMVGFDNGTEQTRILDGMTVESISPNLSGSVDVTVAHRLPENGGDRCLMGASPKGPFDIDESLALEMLAQPTNPTGRPNSDVVRPVVSGVDITKNSRCRWTIDFGLRSERDCVGYEQPFEHVKKHVYPVRSKNRRKSYAERWWQYAEARPAMRSAMVGKHRVVATPEVSKHRLFAWVSTERLLNQQTLVFPDSNDFLFGLLTSHVHETWARAQATQLRERESGTRYTPTSCFETFPFPEPTDEQREAIGAAARRLDELRENWLNPAEWTTTEVLEFPGSLDGPWARWIDGGEAEDGAERSPAGRGETSAGRGDAGVGTVRYPRVVPRDEEAARKLKKRTLTNLYNERPQWLDLAHRDLDAAVFAAYGWDPAIPDDELLANLLALNHTRAAP